MPSAGSDESAERITQLVSLLRTQLAPSKHSTTGVRAAHPAAQARCTLTQASDRRVSVPWTGVGVHCGRRRNVLIPRAQEQRKTLRDWSWYDGSEPATWVQKHGDIERVALVASGDLTIRWVCTETRWTMERVALVHKLPAAT